MLYLTGQHALNLPCSLDTCGDWHQSALDWGNLKLRESTASIFSDWGIEHNKAIPEHKEAYNIANHIRALLDLLEQNELSIAQGMRDDFICNDSYTAEVFRMVMLLKPLDHWVAIDAFMHKEYMMQWVRFKERYYG